MPISANKSPILAGLFFIAGLFFNTMVAAEVQDAESVNMVEFQHILDSINESKLPDRFKDQLYRDVKNSLMEAVRRAQIPEKVKQTLIRDLKQANR